MGTILGMLFGEHEQVNMNNFFLEYFTNFDEIFEEYYLTHGIKYLVMWKNILPCVHGWKIFKDENLDDKWKWTNFFMNVSNIYFFKEKFNKRNKVEKNYIGLFWKFWHMKCSNHTSSHTSDFLNTLLEILCFATCLMQLKNIACNSKIVACEIF